MPFPSDPAGQTPANTFSPTSTPDANTLNTATYTFNADDNQWSTRDVMPTPPAANSAIATPSITSPVDEANDVDADVDLTITTSAYTVAEGNPGNHASTDWQVLEGKTPKVSLNSVTGVTETVGSFGSTDVMTRTSKNVNSGFNWPGGHLWSDFSGRMFCTISNGAPTTASGYLATRGPVEYWFTTDNGDTWTNAPSINEGSTGTGPGTWVQPTNSEFQNWYIGYEETTPTYNPSIIGLKKDTAFTGSPEWHRFLQLPVDSDNIGNPWSPMGGGLAYPGAMELSNGQYIGWRYSVNSTATRTDKFPVVFYEWSEFVGLTDQSFSSAKNISNNILTNIKPDSGAEGVSAQTWMTSYKTVGTDEDAYNLVYTHQHMANESDKKTLWCTFEKDLDSTSFADNLKTDVSNVLGNLSIANILVWEAQRCIVLVSTGAGTIFVVRNSNTASSPGPCTIEQIEHPMTTKTATSSYIGPDGALYLISDDNLDWVRTFDLVNWTPQQDTEVTGLKAPNVFGSGGRVLHYVRQENDMGNDSAVVQVYPSDQFFNETVLTIDDANKDEGVQGDAFVPGDSIQNQGGMAASGTIFELTDTTVSLFPSAGTWNNDSTQRIRTTIEDFNIVVDTRGDTTNLTSITLPANVLNPSSEYQARVQYRSESNVTSQTSEWSTFFTES